MIFEDEKDFLEDILENNNSESITAEYPEMCLFLDIDGVLVPFNPNNQENKIGKTQKELILQFINKHNPFIVITSDRRIMNTKKELETFLGFSIDSILDQTNLKFKTLEAEREHLINTWLLTKRIQFDKIVIIDDLNLNLFKIFKFNSRIHFIHCYDEKGLTYEDIKEFI